jgi:leucyl-tRNA synthetase
VLANEQVVQGACERCGAQVTKRELTQWFFKVTDYADRLLDDMEQLRGTWPARVLKMQENWIGRSQGRHVTFDVSGRAITVFTTRPDTLYGATFFVVAADAPLALELCAPDRREALEAYRDDVRTLSDIDRQSTDRPKTGVDLGVTALNPVTGEQIPVYAADYVLADYGTGAIMAVPAHDQRDLDFARAFELPVRVVVDTGQPDPTETGVATTGDGVLVNSGPYDGLRKDEAIERDRRRPRGPRRRDGRDQLPAARLAAVAPAASGARRSRSCTAGRAARWPVPTTSCPSGCRPAGAALKPAGTSRWARRPTGCRRPARPAADRPRATPTRWTPSSTRPGTSCATARPTTRTGPSTPRPCASGCRSRSTSAASSTRSCTCSTAASS